MPRYQVTAFVHVYRAAIVATVAYLLLFLPDSRFVIFNVAMAVALSALIKHFLPTYEAVGRKKTLFVRFAVFYVIAVWIWNCFGLAGRRP